MDGYAVQYPPEFCKYLNIDIAVIFVNLRGSLL